MKSLAHLAALCVLLLAGCTPARVTPEHSRIAARYKLFVSADGVYRVNVAELLDIGAAQVDAATLQLFHGDREIAIRVMGEGKDFAIEFYGQASDSPYSAFNVYWLTWDAPHGKRMREVSVFPSSDTPQRTFQDTLRVTQPTLYVPQAGAEAHWFWQSLSAPMTATIPITLTAVLGAPARVRVDLWGSTQDAVAPDHHVAVSFNDTRVADETWDGQGAHAVDAAIPQGVLRAGANTLRLIAPGDTRANADVVLLRSIEISYTRALTARDDALTFEVGPGDYRIEGFSQDGVDLFDITNPDDPGRVVNARGTAGALTFQSDAPRRWLAIAPGAWQPIARIASMPVTNLRATDQPADYIVITPPDFLDALKPLVQWREQHGLKVRVVTTTEIYDEFGYGAESPQAIRAFLDYAYHRWASPAPRFALLVGKASYDYRDYLNAPNKNLLPTFLVNTPHLGQAASDNWFVAESEAASRPTLAIGRIPAKTADQVARVVDKIIAYESASFTEAWRQRALFIADDKDPIFAQMADALAAQLPGGIAIQKTDLAQHHGNVETARAELLARWNAGTWLLAYIGHGSIDTWAAGPLLGKEHLAAIQNAQRLPILITPTCLDGYFYHPQMDSLAEALLFKGDGGIVAGFVPTGLSLPQAQSELMQAFFAELAVQPAPTLGQAITQAKQQISAAAPEMREVIETFALLGDPALRVR